MSILDSLITFSLAAALLTITPGLDTALILRTAISEGKKPAWNAALGINTGCFIWGIMIAFGLGALLATSELAYTILKWCGALYLGWLGAQLLLKPRKQLNVLTNQNEQSSNWYVRGILSNLLNPKTGIFYISFLPQFIPVHQSPITWTFILVSIHIVMSTLWSIGLILMTHRATQLLKLPSFTQWMDRLTGGVFVLFAVKLAVSKSP